MNIVFSYKRWINVELFQVALAFIGEWRLLGHINEYLRNCLCLPRAIVCADRICSFWGSAGLPAKEPWIQWYLLQRPGYQTTNKSDLTAADEVCLANRRWNVLFVIDIRECCNYYLNDVLTEQGLICHSITLLSIESWMPRMSSHVSWVSPLSLFFRKRVLSKRNVFSLFKVIHRDLAARNVLVGEEETCKVTDFGMARDVQEDNIYQRKTGVWMFLGKHIMF